MQGRLLRYLMLTLVILWGPQMALANAEVQPRPKTKIKKAPSKPATPEAPPEESVLEIGGTYLEETRQTVSNRVLRLADKVDSLFGDRRADDRKNTSTLRVGQTFFVKDGTTGAEDIEATLNLYLPNFQRVQEKVTDTLMSVAREDTDVTEVDPEKFNKESQWDLNQESGVVIANPINYFGRLRLRRDWLLGKFVHSFYEQVGWSKRSEWEEVTSLTSDYALTRDLLFRFINEKYWAMTNNGLSSAHGPSLLQQISETSAISYDLRYNTIYEDYTFYSNRVSLASVYRRELPVKWIFLEIHPEIAWERETNFRALYNLYIKFEFVFGKI